MGIASKIVKGGLEAVAKKAPRMSEALAPHIGKRLYITQADRTALDYPNKLLGGPGFVELAGIDPALYADKAWAVQTPGIAKTMVGSMANNPEEAIWSTLIGSPEQHRSNKVVFERIMDRFEKAIQEDKLTPELHQTINKRLANMKDPKTGKSFFPEDVDILSPEFNQHAQTFHQRAFIADILGGKGVGGKKGSIIDYPQIIKETTDPLLLDAKTGDIGDRLFSLSGNIEHRPDLHPAFHTSLGGRKESEAFAPAPQGIVLKNSTKDFTERTGRLPTYYDLTRGYAPSEEVTDEMVERMYKLGYGAGGKVLSKGLKLVEDIAEKVKLPPASNSARTQIVGTMPTYEKARDILGAENIKGADILDFGAGKGLGSTSMKADSFEPYPQGWYPTYTKSEDIPSEKYKGLLNLNVLNVLDPEMRAHTVKEIGRVMQPEGGVGLITTRGRDVLNTVGGKAGNEPMSVITSRDTYQKGFEPEELRSYIKHILGSDFEYEPLGLGQAGVKIKKKAEGGTIADDAEEYGQQLKEQRKTLGSDILKSGRRGITEGLGNIYQSAKETLSRAGTFGDIVEGYGKYGAPIEKARYEGITGTKVPEFKPVPYLRDQSITESPADAKMMPLTTGEQQFAGEIIGDPLSYSMSGAGRGLKKVGKFLAEGIAEAEATGKGPVGKVMQTIVPRMNIIKDPGGMLVGGEKAIDEELLNMKKTENNFPHAHQYFVPEGDREALKDPNAVALNAWIDTKVRKYLRNQAGTEADPILKTIESGVEHNFTPPQSGDTKYSIAMKREMVGKPKEGIATTERGKDWEYAVDATFDPVKSKDIKEIINKKMPFNDQADKFRASLLRTEHNLPIYTKEDLEALQLINQIPDENVYSMGSSNLTSRLGLNHVSDVLYEDLASGKLKPEQLNQMSIEKAIRRTAEYDAEKAKEMAKANAVSAEGMPVPREYKDGYKWVELNYTEPKGHIPKGHEVTSMTYDDGTTKYFANTPTTRSSAYNTREEAQKELDDTIKGLKRFREKNKTKEALSSEGEMMGHCVGSYCEDVARGDIKIYSLRSPDGKSHVTIEARPQFSMTEWRNANMDLINSNPKLKQYDFQMRSLDNDHKYGHQMTERDYVKEMSKEMTRVGIEPIEPQGYMELHQVKGKQNKRPDDKYQSYISDFIKNNPTKHEIVDVKELDNTNLMNVQDIADTGLVNKDIHMHPEVEKALKIKYPAFNNLMSADKEEMTYDLFKETARDLARQNKNYLDKDDILNHIREKYLTPPKKAKGGSIDLQQEYKLENMRRRYG